MPEWETLDEVVAWATPIWRSERGRYGRARVPVPSFQRPAWGQGRAYAFAGSHRITLPRWTRGPWMVLHELAHLLVNNHSHGPRFVGALMGLVCRHLEYDATDLMQLADECGVKYDVRSIGSVPTHGLQWRAERALAVEGPMTAIDLACWLSIGTRHEAVTGGRCMVRCCGPLLRAGCGFCAANTRLWLRTPDSRNRRTERARVSGSSCSRCSAPGDPVAG